MPLLVAWALERKHYCMQTNRVARSRRRTRWGSQGMPQTACLEVVAAVAHDGEVQTAHADFGSTLLALWKTDQPSGGGTATAQGGYWTDCWSNCEG